MNRTLVFLIIGISLSVLFRYPSFLSKQEDLGVKPFVNLAEENELVASLHLMEVIKD